MLASTPASADTCTSDDFATVVDEAGAGLRAFNSATVPKIQARLKELQKKRGWSDAELEEKAVQFLHDARISELDTSASMLLEKIDTLGEVPEGQAPDCAKLAELQKAGAELLEVRSQRASYTLARIDAALAGDAKSAPAPAPAAPVPTAATATTAKPKETANAREPAKQTVTKPTAVAQAPAAAPMPRDAEKPATTRSWSSATSTSPNAHAESAATVAMNGPPAVTPLAPAAAGPAGPGYSGSGEGLPPREAMDNPNGYTIDEIRQATRGFFGTISTNLASVIEYAFSNYGRPTGYVLGQEGGGAFLAGLRYGKGNLFMRTGESRPVYWHGPSVGYDFGAEGSRTLFLVYSLQRPEDLFRRFGGVDGSAYLVGGVGLTVLKGGPVVMTPIRTGLGLRLGANIGYLRFTPNATWNPF
ncbi:MAG: DUF1134 domain-containing protein [Hyphomicrobiaceae bacterium]|nr:DUF1134 domain-containing protein [Hyphomicrobiaceae bacterium]